MKENFKAREGKGAAVVGFSLFPPPSYTFVLNQCELRGSAGQICALGRIFLYVFLAQNLSAALLVC